VTPDGKSVYVINSSNNSVSVIDTATNMVTATVYVGYYPWGVAVTPDGKSVYVTNGDSDTVSVIDTTTNAVTANVSVGDYPRGVAVTPDGNRVYAANFSSNTVSVIDTSTNTVSATVAVGIKPLGISIGPVITNKPPTASPTGGGTYEINTLVVLGGQVADVDGDTLDYKWMEGSTTLCSGNIATVEGGSPVSLPSDAISNLCLGAHTLTLEVCDGINPLVSSDITVVINDETAPVISPAPDKTILWPPDHKMVPVTIYANASDNSGKPVNLTALVTSNEPHNGLGDGDMSPDWTEPVINNGIITLQLRAERSGKGNGRTYTVTILATDEAGNTSTAQVNILVPHDRGK